MTHNNHKTISALFCGALRENNAFRNTCPTEYFSRSDGLNHMVLLHVIELMSYRIL